MEQYFENNRKLWNRRTALHKDSEFYDLPGFMAGASSLKPLELEALGEVSGKTLLHLQCHFGLDTLSWARQGASVTGVDFSEDSIALAKKIRQESSLQAEFICCNVYDFPKVNDQLFDVVFTSYGVLCWLPDLSKWAQIVSDCLKPGGVFYIVEFHPVLMMFDEVTGEMKYPYFHEKDPHAQEVAFTYANQSQALNHQEYSWNHSLADVVNALCDQGLTITSLNEYPFSSYNCFADLALGADGYYWERSREGQMPLMFSIKAKKP